MERFLRGGDQEMTYHGPTGVFNGISHARNFTYKHFTGGRLHPFEHHSATGTWGGRGKSSYVQIRKTDFLHRAKVKAYTDLVDEAAALRVLLATTGNDSAAPADNRGDSCNGSNGSKSSCSTDGSLARECSNGNGRTCGKGSLADDTQPHSLKREASGNGEGRASVLEAGGSSLLHGREQQPKTPLAVATAAGSSNKRPRIGGAEVIDLCDSP